VIFPLLFLFAFTTACTTVQALTIRLLCCTVYETQPSIGPKSMHFATLLCLTPPMEGCPWDDLREILHGGQRMASVHSGEEMLPEASNPEVGCTNVSDDRRQTDGFLTAKTQT